MLSELIISRIEGGLTYQQYKDNAVIQISKASIHELESTDKEIFDYIKLNIQRMARIDKSYKVSKELKALLSLINKKQIWMIITENWCGDSAQNLPYLAAMAHKNRNIELKLVLRDSNPDIMDLYLTQGTRSIPKLVAFDENWNELFRWGPRPQKAWDMVIKLKNEGLPKEEYLKQLHFWYAQNRGNDIEAEMSELIKKCV